MCLRHFKSACASFLALGQEWDQELPVHVLAMLGKRHNSLAVLPIKGVS